MALALASVALAATSAASQPRVLPGSPDGCAGASDAYWIEPLLDALEDRAALACACRTRSGPARAAVSIAIDPPGVVRDVAVTTSTETTSDEASCLAHRVRSVTHAWLASMLPRLEGGTLPRRARASVDALPYACSSPADVHARSTLSLEYERLHPDGLRRGASLPPADCRRPLAADLHVTFVW